jgi:hypothetical protein
MPQYAASQLACPREPESSHGPLYLYPAERASCRATVVWRPERPTGGRGASLSRPLQTGPIGGHAGRHALLPRVIDNETDLGGSVVDEVGSEEAVGDVPQVDERI